jgi:hypothetical protein
MLDRRVLPHAQAESTAGEAVAGMLRHGWGFSPRPLSFTPPCLANKPLDLLLPEGVRAAMGNRLTLGRTLEEVHA